MTDRHEPTRGAGGDRLPPVLDRALGRALRDLSRERAAAGFTRRVLDRLDSMNGSPVPRRFAALGSGWSGELRWAAGSALAAVALGTLVTLVALELDPPPEGAEVPPPAAVAEAAPAAPAIRAVPEPMVNRVVAPAAAPAASPDRLALRAENLAALDAERVRIAHELAELRRLAREPLPVVYVGGDETVDFVVDLQSLSRMARLEGSGLGDRTLRPTATTIEDPERNPR
jgi:hypothetical protein